MRTRRSASLRACAVAVLSAACVTSIGLAQTGVHPVTGRQYAQTMSVEGAPWLERREREREEDPELGLRLLKVAKGSTVGDVGAGSGFMSLRLARLVGPQGRVYAVDGNAYFSRPGPRIVDSLELLAELIHPELCAGWGPRDAWQPLANVQLRMIEIH